MIAVVLGSGGHSGEMCQIIGRLPTSLQHQISAAIYGKDDDLSVEKFQRQFDWSLSRKDFKFVPVPRARHVGQSYFTSIATSLHCLFCSILVLSRLRPKLVLLKGCAAENYGNYGDIFLHIRRLSAMDQLFV
jgi:beta-1,4-N-acetylglucosaminyltransferase